MPDLEQPCYWRFVEPHWDNINLYGTSAQFLKDYANLPEPVRHLLTCTWCHSEVCNGGFHQFFGNPTGVLAPEAALGFQTVGLLGLAAVVSEAMSFFGKEFPREQPIRERQLSKYASAHREEWEPICRNG